MKLIIAGSRSITDYSIVLRAMELSPFSRLVTEIVSGTAPGVDQLGERFARDHSIPVHYMPANWNEYGKRSGFVRNTHMAAYAEALLAIWDGQSKGTVHMISVMRTLGKPCLIHIPKSGTDLSNNLHHLTMYPVVRPGWEDWPEKYKGM